MQNARHVAQNAGNTAQNDGHTMQNVSRTIMSATTIECEGWRRHSSLIFLMLLFTKPNTELSGWLYQTKTHFTHIVYQPFSRVSAPSFTLYGEATLGHVNWGVHYPDSYY